MSEFDRDLVSLICSPSRLRALTDADLMESLCAGCNDALAVLFERHSPLVFRTARVILRDDGEADIIPRVGFCTSHPIALSWRVSARNLELSESTNAEQFNMNGHCSALTRRWIA
jgi:hypothetical protein